MDEPPNKTPLSHKGRKWIQTNIANKATNLTSRTYTGYLFQFLNYHVHGFLTHGNSKIILICNSESNMDFSKFFDRLNSIYSEEIANPFQVFDEQDLALINTPSTKSPSSLSEAIDFFRDQRVHLLSTPLFLKSVSALVAKFSED